MNRIQQIIKEAVRDALNEAKSIKSRRLQNIVSQYGGIYRSDNRFGRQQHKGEEHYSVDLHNIADSDVIGVLGAMDAKRIANNRDLGVEYADRNGFELGPTDVIEAVRLADGEHYVMVVSRRYYSETPLVQKRDERAENKRYDGSRQYIRPRQIRNESVRSAIKEARSIKSDRLQSILSKHGGPGRQDSRFSTNQSYDLHNMRDEDIICVVPFDEYRTLFDKKYEIDHGKWSDNKSLEVWAKNQRIKLEPGDRIGALHLKDGMVLLFINRNEDCVDGRGGWMDYHEKREQRNSDKWGDGSKRYIPKHTRPFEHGQIWKNPYRRGWDKSDVADKMDAIRRYNDNPDRPTNY